MGILTLIRASNQNDYDDSFFFFFTMMILVESLRSTDMEHFISYWLHTDQVVSNSIPL